VLFHPVPGLLALFELDGIDDLALCGLNARTSHRRAGGRDIALIIPPAWCMRFAIAAIPPGRNCNASLALPDVHLLAVRYLREAIAPSMSITESSNIPLPVNAEITAHWLSLAFAVDCCGSIHSLKRAFN
jgi:hypothetical protein